MKYLLVAGASTRAPARDSKGVCRPHLVSLNILPIDPHNAPQRLLWILRETFEPAQTRPGGSFLADTLAQGKAGLAGQIFEVGPRLTFSTAYSSNAVRGTAGGMGFEGSWV